MGRVASPLLRKAVADAITGVLYRALSGAQGDVELAARTSRTYFYTLMKRYGIKIERRARVVQIAALAKSSSGKTSRGGTMRS